LNYSYRASYKTLSSADSGTTINSGINTGTRSNILLIIRGQSTSGLDAVIPSGYTVGGISGETTTGTPVNRTISPVTLNYGAISFGMYASNGTIAARGFAANYGNTPTSAPLTEYSSNTTGINLYVKALTSYASSTGVNITTQRDNITYSMADYGSAGTLVFYMQMPAPTGGSRTYRPVFSPYKTNSPALTTSNYKFGTASLNVQSGVAPVRNDFSSGSPGIAWTIEWWGYQTTNPTNSPGWFDMNNDAGQSRGPIVYFNTSTTLRVIVPFGSIAISSIATPSLNAWHHYALVREGTGANLLKFYIDGVLSGTGTDPTSYGTWRTTIGGLNYITNSTGSQSGPFLIDEFRLSNTARYTAAFTPPTAAFTNDANTLELYHFDGANGSYYFPDDNA
jgi:hypothetical protein